MFKNIFVYAILAFLSFSIGLGLGVCAGTTTIINESPKPTFSEVPMPDGRMAKILPGHSIDITMSESPGQAYNHQENEQTATGPGLTSGNVDALPKVDVGTSPSITSSGIFSGKGFAFSVTQVIKNGLNVLYIIGGICIVLGGVVSWIMKDWTALLYIGGAGILIIAAAVLMDQYPWIVLVAGIAVLALLGWWVYRTFINKATTTAVVQQSDAEAQFKKLISESDKFTTELKLVISDLWTKAKAMTIDTPIQKTIDKIV